MGTIYDRAPIKSLDIEALVSLAGSTPCALSRITAGRAQLSQLHGESMARAPHLDPFWTLPSAFLPLADFNLSPFPVTSHTCGNNSLQ